MPLDGLRDGSFETKVSFNTTPRRLSKIHQSAKACGVQCSDHKKVLIELDDTTIGSFLYNCFYMAAMGSISSILPIYATELGADITTIGPIWTIAFLASFAMALFWGSISDRTGNRTRHIVVGTATLSLICILYTFTQNIFHMSAVMILGEMLGSSQAFPIFMSFVSETTRADKRGRSMGFFWMGGSAGWGLSVSAAGFIAQHYGIRTVFCLSSGLFVLDLLVVRIFSWKFLISRKMPLGKHAGFGDSIKDFRRFGLPFMIFWSATVCFCVTDIVKISYVLLFFERELLLDRTLATLILSLATWAEIPSLPVLGALSDKLGRKPLLLLGLITAFLFNLLISLSQNSFHAGLTMLLYGIIWGSFTSAGSAFVGDLVDEQNRAKAMGLYSSAFSIASIVAPTLMSLAILWANFRTAFILIAIIAIVGFFSVLFGVRETKLEN